MSSFSAGARAIIENENGDILMVQEGKDEVHRTWDFPGGGMENGESVTECIKREVLEETGFKIKIEDLLGVYKDIKQRDDTEAIGFMFKAEVMEKKFDETPEGEEIIKVDFIPEEKIPELELRHENRREMLERYQEGESYPLDILWKQLELL